MYSSCSPTDRKHVTKFCTRFCFGKEMASGRHVVLTAANQCRLQLISADCSQSVQTAANQCRLQTSQCRLQPISADCSQSVQTAASQCRLQPVSADCSQSVHTAANQCTLQPVSTHCSQSVHTAASQCRLVNCQLKEGKKIWRTLVQMSLLFFYLTFLHKFQTCMTAIGRNSLSLLTEWVWIHHHTGHHCICLGRSKVKVTAFSVTWCKHPVSPFQRPGVNI